VRGSGTLLDRLEGNKLDKQIDKKEIISVLTRIHAMAKTANTEEKISRVEQIMELFLATIGTTLDELKTDCCIDNMFGRRENILSLCMIILSSQGDVTALAALESKFELIEKRTAV